MLRQVYLKYFELLYKVCLFSNLLIIFKIKTICFLLLFHFNIGRSSKTNSECGEIEQHRTTTISSLSSSSIKRPNKVSSICLNIPAVGLGARPPSIISTDEGGFNEPSPEIKAKLKPSYTFETPEEECQIQQQQSDKNIETSPQPPLPPLPPAPLQPDYDSHTLHYVDFGYRLNPDGSESRQIFGESELYQQQKNNDHTAVVDNYKKNDLTPSIIKNHSNEQSNINGFSTAADIDSVLYAVIKPEVPPPNELFLDCDYDAINAENEKIYHSPQTMLDPTRPNLSRENILDEFVDHHQTISEIISSNVKIVNQNSNSVPSPPPRPPLPDGPPLDLQDVEYADASDKDEDCYLADDMTADEADRLLSSR